jgi:hypothetical protein
MATEQEQMQAKSPRGAIRNWVIKRGILFLLTQMPLVAFYISIAFHWTTFPIATAFTVVLSFVLLPIWISYRKSRSDDPDEPVHHFFQYAVWALVPYVVYNISRIPTYFLLRVVFWDHWYGYGAQLIVQPPDRWASLATGTLVHSIQGYVLVLGYFILFRRRTLLSTMLYVWVFLSLQYSYIFPHFVLIDFRPGPRWYFVVWWAHFWMGLTAWYVPRLYGRGFGKRLKSPPVKVLGTILIVLVYLSPIGFVFWRAYTWQFPLQRSIDNATFRQVRLVTKQDPVLVSKNPATQEAYYRFVLRFGPRGYIDYINATKAVDAGPVRVTGMIMYGGEQLAYCFRHIPALESPKYVTTRAKYLRAVKRMEFSDVAVDCTGPVGLADRFGLGSSTSSTTTARVDVSWTAVATLVGDRYNLQRKFGGGGVRDLVYGTWNPTFLRPDPVIETLGRRQVF